MLQPTRRQFLGSLAAAVAAGSLPLKSRAAVAEMTHHERIAAALAHAETDRVPFSFWWHFPNRDRSPRRLAELTVELYRRLDTDFVKFSPYGLYSVVDWGVELDIAEGFSRAPRQAYLPIQQPDDWRRLELFSGTDGEYLVLLEAQRIALEMLNGEVPVVQTIFSPLTSAAKMAGGDTLLRHMQEDPAAVHAGLEVITETTRRFVAEVVARGADGVFFANQWVDPDALAPALYAEFSRPYDLQVLEPTRDAWFNIFHLHGEKISFDQVLDYPVQAFNYHDRDYGPSLAEMRQLTDKCLVGGIAPGLWGPAPLVNGTPADVVAEVEDAVAQLGGRGLIVAPGEVISLESKAENIAALRAAVEATRLP